MSDTPPPANCDVADSVPYETTAGGRSIEEVLIITNHLPGEESCQIFVMAIKAISDCH